MRFPLELPIAGLYYHYREEFPNRMFGYIKSDPENIHDPEAIGIYNSDYGLIGYIPKDCTSFVRAWAGTNSPEFRCWIVLSVEPDYDRYYGSVCIFDTNNATDFNGKNICLNVSLFRYDIAKCILESLGAKSKSTISKSLDYYVYDTELDDSIKCKIGAEGYHFEPISFTDFIKKTIPSEKRNPFVYGRVVSPSSASASMFEDYLRMFIIFEGGIYRKHYNKTITEVVALKTDHATKISTKAEADGKEIIRCSDLMPHLYPFISRGGLENKSTYDEETIHVVPDEQHHASMTSAQRDNVKFRTVRDRGEEQNSTGCIFTLLIVLGFLFNLFL